MGGYSRDNYGHFRCIDIKILVKPSKKLAEFFGIMLGDGNLYIKDKNYQTRIAGNSLTDKEYFRRYILPLCNQIFKKKFSLVYKKNSSIFACSSRRYVAETLINYGFKPGDKKQNNLGIPPWILNNKSYIKSCLRGLIDTDGSVYPRNKSNRYPNIWFKSAIPKLREDISFCFNVFGFKPTKWSYFGTPQIALNKREDVLRYYNEIGFSNPKHIKRFREFWNTKPP